jgi:hypothetical protein
MMMNAMILGGDVQEGKFYQPNGELRHTWSVVLTVLDLGTKEKHDCQFTEGFARLEELKEMKRQGRPIEEQRQVADVLRGELPQEFTRMPIEVLRFKGNSPFIKLICRFPQQVAG